MWRLEVSAAVRHIYMSLGFKREGYPVGEEGTLCFLTSFHSYSFTTIITGNEIFGAQNSRLVQNVACIFGTDRY